MRLYDRLSMYGLTTGQPWEDRDADRIAKSIVDAAPEAVVILADDIASAWVKSEPITDWKGPRMVVSPFPVSFIEARIPKRPPEVERSRLNFAYMEGCRVGLLTVREPWSDTGMPLMLVDDSGLPDEDPAWVQHSYWLLHFPFPEWAGSGPVRVVMAASHSYIKPDGTLMRSIDGKALSFAETLPRMPHVEEYLVEFGSFFHHVFHLMHCKNIGLRDEYQTRQARRKRERMGAGDWKYKVLTINPTMTPGSGSQRGARIGDMPAHLVRGHFATYSEDNPLFGKYTGTFWRPAHVRGNADNGTVYKDYKVKAPKV